MDKYRNVIYIGRTKHINIRMRQHFQNGHLDKECYDQTKYIEFTEFDSGGDMYIYEIYLICKYKPKFNTEFKLMNTSLSLEEPSFKTYDKVKKYDKRNKVKKDISSKSIKIKNNKTKIILTERDFKIIDYIIANVTVSTEELNNIFFPNASLRTCQARLKLLVDVGLISNSRVDILSQNLFTFPKTKYKYYNELKMKRYIQNKCD